MGWVFLEIVVVIAIAIGIVWWTIPRKPKSTDGAGKPAGKDEPPRG